MKHKDKNNQEMETIKKMYKISLEGAKKSVVQSEHLVALIDAQILKPCDTFGCNCLHLTKRGIEIINSEFAALAESEEMPDIADTVN